MAETSEVFLVPQYTISDMTLFSRFRSELFKVNHMAETSEDFVYRGIKNRNDPFIET